MIKLAIDLLHFHQADSLLAFSIILLNRLTHSLQSSFVASQMTSVLGCFLSGVNIHLPQRDVEKFGSGKMWNFFDSIGLPQ
jgi:hypothetical protein